MYCLLLLYFFLLSYFTNCKTENDFKTEFCSNLSCENGLGPRVCGIKVENQGVRLRYFENECELLKYGCEVNDEEAYGIVNIEYCQQSLFDGNIPSTAEPEPHEGVESQCIDFDCSYPDDARNVCGIKEEGNGFKVRLFSDKCQLIKFNCINKTNFTATDLVYCNGLDVPEPITTTEGARKRKIPNLFIVDANMYNFNNNINDTIDNFFAATHMYNIPVEDINKHLNESGRRRLVALFGPQVIYRPWTVIPENVSEDRMHEPTLGSCFHKCPTECPDTYAPVCGNPGTIAEEPSLMFQNHCFMDAAQCKMRWEDKSSTSLSSYYIESNFLFCLGDTMNTLYRFLPLVRTLQHMGRLKKKGIYKYRLRNLRFANNMVLRDSRIQGKK